MDLRYFIPIFERLEQIFIKGVCDLPHSKTYHLENTILIDCLKYLSHLLKNATQKRYFLSIEVILSISSFFFLVLFFSHSIFIVGCKITFIS